MIKLFRKIRQQLLTENLPTEQAGKFNKPASPAGRYLIYAIGEIILVVIGILIALSINTWNENKKRKETIKIYLQNFVEDLKDDKKHGSTRRS